MTSSDIFQRFILAEEMDRRCVMGRMCARVETVRLVTGVRDDSSWDQGGSNRGGQDGWNLELF